MFKYQTNCTCITKEEWDALMKGAKPLNYKWLVNKIKRAYPEMYRELCLNFYNPYWTDCAKTKTHYILVHSSIEYFFTK